MKGLNGNGMMLATKTNLKQMLVSWPGIKVDGRDHVPWKSCYELWMTMNEFLNVETVRKAAPTAKGLFFYLFAVIYLSPVFPCTVFNLNGKYSTQNKIMRKDDNVKRSRYKIIQQMTIEFTNQCWLWRRLRDVTIIFCDSCKGHITYYSWQL